MTDIWLRELVCITIGIEPEVDYLAQEVDGHSHFSLEDVFGALLTELQPAPVEPTDPSDDAGLRPLDCVPNLRIGTFYIGTVEIGGEQVLLRPLEPA